MSMPPPGHPYDPYQQPDPYQQQQPDPYQQGQPGWGDPYQQSAPPYGSPTQPTQQMPGWPAPGPPMGPPPGPPPPKKSNTGLIIGLVAGGAVVLLVALCVAGLLAGLFKLGKEAEKAGGATAGPSTSTATSTGEPPTGGPTPRDPASLDSASTDTSEFSTTRLYPEASFTGEDGVSYSRAAAGLRSACTDGGGPRVQALLSRHGCTQMAVGVYLNSGQTIMTGVMVFPLPDAAKADAAYQELTRDRETFNQLSYWCPQDPAPGSKVCDKGNQASPSWHGSYRNTHRYLVIAIALYTDGRQTTDYQQLEPASTAVWKHVVQAILEN